MHWNSKEKPRLGNKRITKKFTLFPVTVGLEHSWLEVAYIAQVYRQGYLRNKWRSFGFVDEVRYKKYLETGFVETY